MIRQCVGKLGRSLAGWLLYIYIYIMQILISFHPPLHMLVSIFLVALFCTALRISNANAHYNAIAVIAYHSARAQTNIKHEAINECYRFKLNCNAPSLAFRCWWRIYAVNFTENIYVYVYHIARCLLRLMDIHENITYFGQIIVFIKCFMCYFV